MITIGNVQIFRVEELLAPSFTPEFLFPDWRPEYLDEHLNWMAPYFYDRASGKFMSSIHSWVIRLPDHTILVDACAGNDKARPSFDRFNMLHTQYLARLHAIGVRPEDIDFVFCTHLHVDHVGWNTRLVDGRWVPTFPRAKYLFARRECEYWNTDSGEGGKLAINAGAFDDSVRPVLEAGLAEMIDPPYQITENLVIEAAPGHSPGHCILVLRSGGETAIFSADTMHQPVQVYEPHLNSRFCHDPVLARQSRRAVLERCACSNGWLLPAHFGRPHLGRITERGGRFAFSCEDVAVANDSTV